MVHLTDGETNTDNLGPKVTILSLNFICLPTYPKYTEQLPTSVCAYFILYFTLIKVKNQYNCSNNLSLPNHSSVRFKIIQIYL